MVGARVADDLAGAGSGAVGGLDGELGLAVAVVVEHLELRVVRTRADVAAEVDAPQPGPVQLVGVEVDVARVAGVGVVLGVGRVPLHDDLVLAVAVEIADAGVVRGVGVPLTRWCGPARWDLQRYVAAAGHDAGLTRNGIQRQRLFCGVLGSALDPVGHGPYDVLGARGRTGIHEAGRAADGRLVHLDAVAVDVEGDAGRVVGQLSPADPVAFAGVHTDHTAVQVVDLWLRCLLSPCRGRGIARSRRRVRQQCDCGYAGGRDGEPVPDGQSPHRFLRS